MSKRTISVRKILNGDAPAPQPRWVEVNAAGVRVENLRQFGGPWFALQLIRLQGLDTFLQQSIPEGREQFPWDISCLVLMIARRLEPSSERYIAEQWYPKTALPDLPGVSEERLDDNLDKKIEDALIRLQTRCEKQKRNPLRVEREIGRLLERNSRAAKLFAVKVTEREPGAAHMFVCFLVYVLWQTLSQLCSRAGLGEEPRRVLAEFSEIRSLDVVLPTKSAPEIRTRCISSPPITNKTCWTNSASNCPPK